MRASTARLMNSPVRLADLTFPQVNRLIHRTRLGFIHLDNLLAFAKRDRDGRVDGYITAYLPDECVLLLFRKGEAVNAASLHTAGRQVVTITEALKRMRARWSAASSPIVPPRWSSSRGCISRAPCRCRPAPWTRATPAWCSRRCNRRRRAA